MCHVSGKVLMGEKVNLYPSQLQEEIRKKHRHVGTINFGRPAKPSHLTVLASYKKLSG
jgi:hypothetical protein